MSAVAQGLTASLENYLEAILLLARENNVARSRDIARRLKVKMSSVTGALQTLREKGFVNYEPYGFVTLTAPGTEAAERVLRRHEALRDFLVNVLSIEADEADEAACQMEHGVSKGIVDRLIEFAEFVETCPRAGAKWVRGFGCHCAETPHTAARCRKCIEDSLRDMTGTERGRSTVRATAVLTELKPGEKGRIRRLHGEGAVKRRIRGMGVDGGNLVEVIRVAPDGDPIEIKVKGYHLTLRLEEAAGIEVARVGRT